MTKYEELEKLQELKANGGITEKEFELEKSKILNANDNTTKRNISNRKMSKLFFILFGISLVITIIFGVFEISQQMNFAADSSKRVERLLEKRKYESMAKFQKSINNTSGYQESLNEIKKIEAEIKREETISSVITYGTYISGGITIILLATVIVFKVKEKGGIKIVD